MMVLVSCQEDIGVGIAPGADDVVHASTVLVPPVPAERVVGDGRHRAQVRQTAPQSVAGADMRRMQRPRLAAEEMRPQQSGLLRPDGRGVLGKIVLLPNG